MKCQVCNTHQAAPGYDFCDLCAVDEFYRRGKVAEKKDIVVTIIHNHPIELIQQIEKSIDKALTPLGFSRSTTSHDQESCSLVYFQFGSAL